jgi:hypothetical protein
VLAPLFLFVTVLSGAEVSRREWCDVGTAGVVEEIKGLGEEEEVEEGVETLV